MPWFKTQLMRWPFPCFLHQTFEWRETGMVARQEEDSTWRYHKKLWYHRQGAEFPHEFSVMLCLPNCGHAGQLPRLTLCICCPGWALGCLQVFRETGHNGLTKWLFYCMSPAVSSLVKRKQFGPHSQITFKLEVLISHLVGSQYEGIIILSTGRKLYGPKTLAAVRRAPCLRQCKSLQ